MSLNYLATRFTCSWPWTHRHAAVRWPAGLRLRRSVRKAGPRRHPDHFRVGGLDRRDRVAAAPGHQRRRLAVLRRLPAEAAAEEGRSAAAARAGRRHAALPPVCRVHRRLQHLVRPGLLRAGNRHHPDATGRDARLRPLHPGDRRSRTLARDASTSSTTARLSSTSARSRCASTSRRSSRTSISTPAPTGSPSPRTSVKRLVHSGIDEVTFSIDGARAGELRQIPAARRLREGDPQPAASRRRKNATPAATCRSSTGATSSSRTTTRTRRWTSRASWPRSIGVDRLCWELTDHPEDMFSRRFVPGHAGAGRRSRHHIWDANNLGNAIPGATPRAEITVGGTLPGAADHRAARTQDDDQDAWCATRSTRAFPAQASYGRRLVRLGAQLCDAVRRGDQPGLRARLAAGQPRVQATALEVRDDDHAAGDSRGATR